MSYLDGKHLHFKNLWNGDNNNEKNSEDNKIIMWEN